MESRHRDEDVLSQTDEEPIGGAWVHPFFTSGSIENAKKTSPLRRENSDEDLCSGSFTSKRWKKNFSDEHDSLDLKNWPPHLSKADWRLSSEPQPTPSCQHLLLDIKRIYASIVTLEAKCKDLGEKLRVASEEEQPTAVSEEGRSRAASEEEQPRTASEEERSRAASEEDQPRTASEGERSRAASEEEQPRTTSEEERSITASEGERSRTASEEEEPRTTSEEERSRTASEGEQPRATSSGNLQWQALIILHEDLLDKQHDFLMAAHHPSASVALTALAVTYNMPDRLWIHGIYPILNFFNDRLPDSWDYILRFINIAYAMLTLFSERVLVFEGLWIKYLGDLSRYCWSIEVEQNEDREAWNLIARMWYSKAASRYPNGGRLYHHLAILASPDGFQQLGLYSKSLTCVTSYDKSASRIEGEFSHDRSTFFQVIFIKAHAILCSDKFLDDFDNIIQHWNNDLFHYHVEKVGAKFKEQGVLAAVSNIAALLEYGAARESGAARAIFRLAFNKVFEPEESQVPIDGLLNVNETESLLLSATSYQPTLADLTSSELEKSLSLTTRASSLAFGILSAALLRVDDENVLPLIHVYFVFIYGLALINDARIFETATIPSEAMRRVSNDIPWVDICSFLNTWARSEAFTSQVLAEDFPHAMEDFDRTLPEDFILQGLVYSQHYHPPDWFRDLPVDDDERTLERPSVTLRRVERILWLGIRIASSKQWITYDDRSEKFSAI